MHRNRLNKPFISEIKGGKMINTTPMDTPQRRKQSAIKRQIPGYAFISFAVFAMLALIVYPLMYGLYISFYNTNLLNKWNFVSLRYYIESLTQTDFYLTLWLTFQFMVCVVAGHFIVGFVLAHFLNHKFRGRLFYRIVFMLPWLFPETVIALLFTWIFNPLYGILNAFLKGIGLINSNISWFGTKDTAFATLVFVCIWKGFPMVMTMILAGMQSISQDYYEAATIDGANMIQQFIYITLPCLKPVLTTVLVLDSVWWFRQYTLVWVLTGGGPGTATTIISIQIFKTAFQDFNFGKASAMAVLVFFVCYGISKIYRGVLRDDR